MYTFRFIFSVLFLVLVLPQFAQNGFIRGTIFEDATGDNIPGVQVQVLGTNTGAVSDLEGKFSITTAPGTYSLKISFMTYQTITINDVVVKEGEVTLFNDIRMKEALNEMAEVVVTAEMAKNNENSLLTMKMKSANLIDGISAANFKKIGDSDAANAMKRVPGVSLSNGKYVYVRGLGDRYNKTTLNGVDIPGLDPDRNAIQMDIFPTAIIDNIIVNKSFAAELPADFTGGVIDISIKDFPESKKGSFSLSTSYNPYFHFNPNYLTYEGGKTDFLGFDDGTREIPAVTNIPFYAEAIGNPEGEKATRYKQILGSFNPTLAAMQQTSLMDFSFGTSFGNQFSKNDVTMGYNLVFSYKNETEFYQNAEFGRYGLSADPDVFAMDAREVQIGDYGCKQCFINGFSWFCNQNKKF
jgi:hypothetical protein